VNFSSSDRNKITLENQQVVQNYGFNLHNIKTGIYSSASAFLTNKPLEDISYKIIKKVLNINRQNRIY